MKPWAPLAWIVFIPVVTVPLTQALLFQVVQSSQCRFYTVALMKSIAICPDGQVVMALLPGLLNLAPLAWLIPRDEAIRRNAMVAATLGALRLVVPVAGVLLLGPSQGQSRIAEGLGPVYPNSDSLDVIAFSIVLWVASIVAWIWLAGIDRLASPFADRIAMKR